MKVSQSRLGSSWTTETIQLSTRCSSSRSRCTNNAQLAIKEENMLKSYSTFQEVRYTRRGLLHISPQIQIYVYTLYICTIQLDIYIFRKKSSQLKKTRKALFSFCSSINSSDYGGYYFLSSLFSRGYEIRAGGISSWLPCGEFQRASLSPPPVRTRRAERVAQEEQRGTSTGLRSTIVEQGAFSCVYIHTYVYRIPLPLLPSPPPSLSLTSSCTPTLPPPSLPPPPPLHFSPPHIRDQAGNFSAPNNNISEFKYRLSLLKQYRGVHKAYILEWRET